ncbi:hypothetical protein OS493_027968 [Desmophyllum pertusum]|uniref:G-protein coupled receptors family 1 profile domain-containing protein n=1 Tax=Desmophyllum pertusum TaxID=174260 RepID=A0A9X0CEU5_9CNID|nr:hypothetical protein OS493_027968 [Desmophyllum pertusum]
MDFTSTIAAMNISNVTTEPPPPGFYVYDPLWAITLRWIIGGIIVLVGSVGNVMVCAVVYKNQRMQTAMNLFLVNLAVWDILVCLFNIPFTLIYNHLKSWPFGLFWCKTMPTLQVMNLSASTGSLVAITVERYRAICLPFTPPLSKFQAKLIIALVSMTSFLVALPEVGAYTLSPPFGCMEIFHSPTLRQAYSLLLFLACYLLPLMFIAPAYTRMIFKLWNNRDENSPSSGVSEDPKNSRRKRNVLRMMVIVVLCYAICMMPTYAIFLWLDFGLTGNPPRVFFILLSFMQMLNFFNSCVNPIIYWCLSEQFSKGFKKILRCNKFHKSWTRQHSSTTSSEPNVQNTVNHSTVPTRV